MVTVQQVHQQLANKLSFRLEKQKQKGLTSSIISNDTHYLPQRHNIASVNITTFKVGVSTIFEEKKP
jgi:hypothetical protein